MSTAVQDRHGCIFYGLAERLTRAAKAVLSLRRFSGGILMSNDALFFAIFNVFFEIFSYPPLAARPTDRVFVARTTRCECVRWLTSACEEKADEAQRAAERAVQPSGAADTVHDAEPHRSAVVIMRCKYVIVAAKRRRHCGPQGSFPTDMDPPANVQSKYKKALHREG